MSKHYLFVCAANVDRSPTAELMMKEMAEQQGFDLEVRSAGLFVVAEDGIPIFGASRSVQLTREPCDWADEIWAMETWHVGIVVRRYGQPAEKVKSLDVPDHFTRGSHQLGHMLRPKLQAILESPVASDGTPP